MRWGNDTTIEAAVELLRNTKKPNLTQGRYANHKIL